MRCFLLYFCRLHRPSSLCCVKSRPVDSLRCRFLAVTALVQSVALLLLSETCVSLLWFALSDQRSRWIRNTCSSFLLYMNSEMLAGWQRRSREEEEKCWRRLSELSASFKLLWTTAGILPAWDGFSSLLHHSLQLLCYFSSFVLQNGLCACAPKQRAQV